MSIGAAVRRHERLVDDADEMEYGLADSRPKVLIADDERVERIAAGARRTARRRRRCTSSPCATDGELPADAVRWADVVASRDAPGGAARRRRSIPTTTPCIFYTSGTTGFPKGAQLTHRGSVHNIMHIVFMTTAAGLADGEGGRRRRPSRRSTPTGDAARRHVFMAPTPLFHVTANNCLLHPRTLAGRRHRAHATSGTPGRALELIEREGVTNFSGVPTMSRELLLHPDWSTRDTSSLSGMGGGGAPLQPDLVDKIDKSLAGPAARRPPATG